MGDHFDEARQALEENRVDIVQILDPERVFDDLRTRRVLDQEDCEEIACRQTYPTLQGRAGKFLDILSRKGPEAYDIFCEIIERKHPHLFKLLTKRDPRPFTPPPGDNDVTQDAQEETADQEPFVTLAKKFSSAQQEIQRLKSHLTLVSGREKELTRENDKWKKKLEYQRTIAQQNKRLRETVEDYKHRLNQVTEEKCNAVQRSLNYQSEKELASTRLHQTLVETEELRRKLNRLEGDCAFERCQSTRLRNELRIKPKVVEVDELKRENQLLKSELNNYMSIANQSILKEEDDQIAILQSERESAQNELKQTVDQLFTVRQECHATEEERDKLSVRVQQLQQEMVTLQKDCETYKKRKEELWEQLSEREKERNQAVRERDKALNECAQKTRERDEYFGNLYRLQEELDAIEQDNRKLKKLCQTHGHLESCSDQGCRELSQSNDTDVETKDPTDETNYNEDEDGFVVGRPKPFRKRSQVISRSSSEAHDISAQDDVFELAFKDWHSEDDLLSNYSYKGPLVTPKSESRIVHPPTMKDRILRSRRVFSERRGFTEIDIDTSSFDEEEEFDEIAEPKKIKRRGGVQKRGAGSTIRRSTSCSGLARALEDMILEETTMPDFADSCSSVEARSSIKTNSSQSHSLPTTGTHSTTSDYISDNQAPSDGRYEVLLYCATLTREFEITGGNSVGIFVKWVRALSKAQENGITVGDEILKITGNIRNDHRSESFKGSTLEQAHNALGATAGWVKVSLKHNQAEFERLRLANDTSDNNIYGDSFYVRAHFKNGDGYVKKDENSSLFFEPGDVLHVSNTAHGGKFGTWFAKNVSSGESGVIPNYHGAIDLCVKMDEAVAVKHGSSLTRFVSGSAHNVAQGCFPMEKKPSLIKKKFSMRPGKSIKFGQHPKLPYKYVKSIKVSEPRPVLMVGATGLVGMIRNQLSLSDLTKDQFELPDIEEIVAAEEEMDQQTKKTGDIVDSVKEDGNFKCLTIANIKKVIKKGKHCLCYVDNVTGALAKLHAQGIYPIIVVFTLKEHNEKDHHTVFIHGETIEKMRQQLQHADQNIHQLNLFYPKAFQIKQVEGVDRKSINDVVTTISRMVKTLNDEDVWIEKEKAQNKVKGQNYQTK